MSEQPDLRAYQRMLAEATGRAPSLHNSQPWRIRIGADLVEVWLDRDRVLPVADPVARQAHLSVGAAAFAARLGLAGAGWSATGRLRPDPRQPDLAVVLRATAGQPLGTAERRLIRAMAVRRTIRTPFRAEEVPVPVRIDWAEQAEVEGAELRWVERVGERRGLADLVARAERRQQADPAYRAELAAWTVGAVAGEGVPVHALGVTAAAGHSAEFPLRDFAGGREVPDRHPGPTEERPTVAVLGTTGDHAEDWLRGGQALMRVLLTATADGYAASFLNQPLEFPGLRRDLRDELRMSTWPQVVLRLGRPTTVPPMTARRSVADLILTDRPVPDA